MTPWARRFTGVVAATITLALTACGQMAGSDRRNQLTEELVENRGFTNVVLEKVSIGEREDDSAVALVSFGGCRIRLTWSEKTSWKLAEGSEVPEGTIGEITASMLAKHPSYKECASQPAPDQSSPKSS